ncbi:integrase [Salmonella enterica]|uniref:Integrase n=1 Tax=Salmonella enterica TaxID=28901 RepID=A0A402WI13_SALER|nr:integrase [Salmonella enterica]EAS2071548.1 integrase [Salmonella enterica]EAX5487399.1 integrase [Salmonella enterica]MIV45235.1 integrase [Salmonella enterica]
MSISKLPDGRYLMDLRPSGSDGKRIRKKFTTRGEAKDYERWAMARYNTKEWKAPVVDDRYLLELIEIWWKVKGQMMRDGERTHNKLLVLDRALGHPLACDVTPKLFSDYRARRTTAGIKPKTLNTEQEHLAAMFNSLYSLGHYPSPNPLKGLALIRLTKSEMGFLTHDEIAQLLATMKGDNLLVAKLCLSTGARWNEVAMLMAAQVMKDRVTFVKTKNGKNRTIPVAPTLIAEILEGRSGRLFPGVDYEAAREAIKNIAPHLPAGQATHVLRHTFASHFMMNGGNILTLQRILGHSNILQTMVYAHFSPDHLIDAVKYNPLTAF